MYTYLGESAIELALNSGYKDLASKIAKFSYIHTRAASVLQQHISSSSSASI
jgi:hypothetical protein